MTCRVWRAKSQILTVTQTKNPRKGAGRRSERGQGGVPCCSYSSLNLIFKDSRSSKHRPILWTRPFCVLRSSTCKTSNHVEQGLGRLVETGNKSGVIQVSVDKLYVVNFLSTDLLISKKTSPKAGKLRKRVRGAENQPCMGPWPPCWPPLRSPWRPMRWCCSSNAFCCSGVSVA